MSKAREERIKLRASYLNGLAIAAAAIGVVAPLVAAVLRPAAGVLRSLALAMVCLIGSFTLHLAGWRTLKELDS